VNPLQIMARSIARPLLRSAGPIQMEDWASMFTLGGLPGILNTSLKPTEEADVTNTFISLVNAAYRGNGVAFACMLARYSLFSEARFVWRQFRNSQPGPLFGTPELSILDEPEPGSTTDELLKRALLDNDLAGDWFGVRRSGQLARIRPDWTTIIVGSPNQNSDLGGWDPDARVLGYAYEPGGPGAGREPIIFLPNEVAHFAFTPDPLFRYRGMPWIVPILRELQGDSSASAHKLAFFRNAATPNVVIKLPSALTLEKARQWIDLFEQEHRGISNAFKTWYFGGGAEAQPIGLDFQQMDFRGLQSGFETRIASASGMHPVIVPFSEGLTGSSLNAGNFQQAARLVADKTLRPLWRAMSGSLQNVLNRPNGAARLWYSEREIPFLRTDVKDEAEIQQKNAATISSYITAGFEPASAVDAVDTGDLGRLTHTGLVSVQLQPPGAAFPARAIGEFWPISGLLSSVGTVARDTVVPSDHPIVRAFPSMFELGTEPLQIETRIEPPQLMTADRAVGDEVRCSNCSRMLGQLSGGFRIRCTRCGTWNERAAPEVPAVASSQSELGTALMAFLTREQPTPQVSVPVNVTTPPVTIEQGAVQVHTPAISAPVTVTTPEQPISLTIEQPARATVQDIEYNDRDLVSRVSERPG